jgi:hypothetical protein
VLNWLFLVVKVMLTEVPTERRPPGPIAMLRGSSSLTRPSAPLKKRAAIRSAMQGCVTLGAS